MKNFDEARPLLKLNQDVLQEIVREAEIKLLAQLMIATAGDQRALTLIGFKQLPPLLP